MSLFSLSAKLTLDSEEYERGIDKAGKKSSMFGEMLRANLVTKGIEVAVKGFKKLADTAVQGVSKVVDSYAQYEQLAGGVETLFKGSADKVKAYADEAYKTAGLSANQYMETVTSFSASLIQSVGKDTNKAADLANQAIIDMSDNANKMGTDMSSIQAAYQGFAKQNYTMLDNLKLGYGGTKSEMDRLIKNAMKMDKTFQANTKTVKKHGKKMQELDYNYADVVKAIHIVQTNMGITGTTAKEAADTIQGSIASTKAAWENVLTAIGTGKGVKDATSNLIASAKNVIKNVVPIIKRGIAGLGDFIVEVLPEAVKELPGIVISIGRTIVKTLPKVVTGIVKTMPAVLSNVWKTVYDLVSRKGISALASLLKVVITGSTNNMHGFAQRKIKYTLQKVFDVVMKSIRNIISQLKDFWDRVGKPLVSGAADLVVKHIIPAILKTKAALEPVFTWLQNAQSALWAYIGDIWKNKVFPLLGRIADRIPEIVKSIVSWWQGKFMPVMEKVFSAVAGYWENTLKPAFVSIYTYVVETLIPALIEWWNDKFKPTIQSVFKAVKTFWVKTLKPALESMYTYVVDTLIPTMIDWWQNHLQPTIETVFNAIAGFWKDTLKPALEAIYTYVVTDLIPTLIVWWEYHLQPTVEKVFTAIAGFWTDTLQPAMEAIYKYVVETLIPTLIDWWQNHLQPAIETVFTAIAGFWNDILKPAFRAIWSYVVVKLIPALQEKWEAIQPVIEGVFTAIAGFWNDILKPAFRAIWSYVVVKLIPALQEKWEAIQPVIEGVFTAIKTFWEETAKPALENLWLFMTIAILPIFQRVGEKVQYIWDTYLKPVATWLVESFGTSWEGLQTSMSALIDFISNIFSGKWSEAWDDLVTMVKTPFDTLGEILKTPINAVIGLINSMIFAVRDAINKVIDGINSHLKIHFDPIDVFGQRIWDGIDLGVNLKRVNWKGIPTLAKGGVVSNGGKAIVGEYQPEFLQMIGGRAVVTPLASTPARFPGWGTHTAAAAAAGTGARDITVIMQLDRQEFARAVYKANSDETQRVGVKITRR